MKRGDVATFPVVLVSVFTLLILFFTLIVWRAEKNGGACYVQNGAEALIDTPTLPPLIVYSLPQESIKRTPSSESYLCRLITPVNLPNIYLVLIGIGGVLAALGTLQKNCASSSQYEKANYAS